MSVPSNPNTHISSLDANQMVVRSFDEDSDAFRIELASGTSFAVVLSASDDSIVSYPVSLPNKASVAASASGIVLAAVSCPGIKGFQLYTNTTSTITSSQACTLEVSPSDTDNVWFATSTTVTPSTTSGVVVASAINVTTAARRARVTMSSGIASGTFDIYLVMQGV